MGEAVDHSLSQLAPEDIRAVVAYLRSVPATASTDLPATVAPPAPASHKEGPSADARGKMVFQGACVSAQFPPKNVAMKGLAIRVGTNAAMLFDTDLLRMAAGWTGGYTRTSTTS